MNGLELAEEFFRNEGLLRIEESNGSAMPYLACGLIGEGSECFGMDDEYSMDHDWGAGFAIWIPEEYISRFGDALSITLRALPDHYIAASRFRNMRDLNDGRIGVFSIEDFYARFTGLRHVPENLEQWWAIPDGNLAVVTNGKVFLDRLGEFTKWRKILSAGYPRDIVLKKMAYCCYIIMQTGQYNFPRMVQRKYHCAAAIVETEFIIAALRLTYYLNNGYPPFYKWLQPLVSKLPVLGYEAFQYSEAMASLSNQHPDQLQKKNEIIKLWCSELMDAIHGQDLSTRDHCDFYSLAQELHGSIAADWLRKIPLEVSC